ncbi:MAG TPA: DnaA N-terminal domain-containing protein, partial [bacterium]|nr:DnaA N-terminal domain-containing protein [bacterium]
MNPQQLWQAALGELELLLSKANFTTWFKSTSISSLEENKVTISVPNGFTKEWLEKKYHQTIVKA